MRDVTKLTGFQQTALNLAGVSFFMAVLLPFTAPDGGWIAPAICIAVGIVFAFVGLSGRSGSNVD